MSRLDFWILGIAEGIGLALAVIAFAHGPLVRRHRAAQMRTAVDSLPDHEATDGQQIPVK